MKTKIQVLILAVLMFTFGIFTAFADPTAGLRWGKDNSNRWFTHPVWLSGGTVTVDSGTTLEIASGGILNIAGSLNTGTGLLTIGSGGITRTGQVYTFTDMKVAGASGTDWVITDDSQKATLAASQTSETLTVKITGLHVGDVITKVNLIGQVESAGGAVVIDADLRKITAVAGDLTDASVGTIVRPTIAADTVLSSAAGKGVSATLDETVGSDETFYVRVTGTTAASTDIALMGVQLTVTQK